MPGVFRLILRHSWFRFASGCVPDQEVVDTCTDELRAHLLLLDPNELGQRLVETAVPADGTILMRSCDIRYDAILCGLSVIYVSRIVVYVLTYGGVVCDRGLHVSRLGEGLPIPVPCRFHAYDHRGRAFKRCRLGQVRDCVLGYSLRALTFSFSKFLLAS